MKRACLRWIAGLLFAVACCLSTSPSQAKLLVSGRGGLAAPVQGESFDDLNLDMGPSTGLTVGLEVWEMVSIEARIDAMWLFGDSKFSETKNTLRGPTTFAFDLETTALSYGITLGPSVLFRHEAAEVYLGFQPGVYLTRFFVDYSATASAPRDFASAEGKSADSDLSVDFGFDAEIGARLFLNEAFFLGAEVGYHLVFLRGEEVAEATEFQLGRTKATSGFESELDENVGLIVAGLTIGYRF